MGLVIKAKDQSFTEQDIQNLVGKTVHVPTNNHEVVVPLDGTRTGTKHVNAWFAGEVAGYEKAYLTYDFNTGDFLKVPKLFFNILLTDGMSYQLNINDSEIVEITEEEFVELIAEYQAADAIEKEANEIIMPEKPRIILPNE